MPISVFTKHLYGKINSKKPQNSSLYAQFVHNYMTKKAQESYEHVLPYIKKTDKFLDVGLGAGTFASLLKNKGYNITGVDVVNLSLYKDIQPDLYDGKKLPYKNNQFDVALVISVLHHCGLKDENKKVLAEAMRVSKKVILIEDTYRNELERKIVSAIDQIANWEFWKHNYLTNKEWFTFIHKMKWHTVFAKQYSQFAFGILYTHYCMFVLQKKS
jgi:ubiquinone/menaquinone biosynthesis C-methylase UbiE